MVKEVWRELTIACPKELRHRPLKECEQCESHERMDPENKDVLCTHKVIKNG